MWYYYVFYVFYGFTDVNQSVVMRLFKAGMALIMLEIWLLATFVISSPLVFGEQSNEVLDFECFVPAAIILAINTKCFLVNDKWKEYNKRFDSWSDAKNDNGKKWVIMGAVTIIALLGLSVLAMT